MLWSWIKLNYVASSLNILYIKVLPKSATTKVDVNFLICYEKGKITLHIDHDVWLHQTKIYKNGVMLKNGVIGGKCAVVVVVVTHHQPECLSKSV